jgi:hypothetical protein
VTARLFEDFAARAGLGPEADLIDVHTYATIVRDGRATVVDVTFAGEPRWDGCSDMPLACGAGTDHDAGEDAMATKADLVERFCAPAVREPFIRALGNPG